MRTAHLAGFAVLIALGAAPLCGAASASVSGIVRDFAGVPQMGAEVELLRADLSVAAIVYTNDKGQYIITSLLPAGMLSRPWERLSSHLFVKMCVYARHHCEPHAEYTL